MGSRQESPKRRLRRAALTLLELVAVVTILGILVAIIVPRFSGHTAYAKRNACRTYKADLNSAIDRYYFDRGSFPVDTTDLTPDYYPNAVPNCPVDGSAYTIDASRGRISGHTH